MIVLLYFLLVHTLRRLFQTTFALRKYRPYVKVLCHIMHMPLYRFPSCFENIPFVGQYFNKVSTHQCL